MPTDSTLPDPQADGTEYDRFRSLAAKLVKVPKKELDEERKRDEAARKG